VQFTPPSHSDSNPLGKPGPVLRGWGIFVALLALRFAIFAHVCKVQTQSKCAIAFPVGTHFQGRPGPIGGRGRRHSWHYFDRHTHICINIGDSDPR